MALIQGSGSGSVKKKKKTVERGTAQAYSRSRRRSPAGEPSRRMMDAVDDVPMRGGVAPQSVNWKAGTNYISPDDTLQKWGDRQVTQKPEEVAPEEFTDEQIAKGHQLAQRLGMKFDEATDPSYYGALLWASRRMSKEQLVRLRNSSVRYQPGGADSGDVSGRYKPTNSIEVFSGGDFTHFAAVLIHEATHGVDDGPGVKGRVSGQDQWGGSWYEQYTNYDNAPAERLARAAAAMALNKPYEQTQITEPQRASIVKYIYGGVDPTTKNYNRNEVVKRIKALQVASQVTLDYAKGRYQLKSLADADEEQRADIKMRFEIIFNKALERGDEQRAQG